MQSLFWSTELSLAFHQPHPTPALSITTLECLPTHVTPTQASHITLHSPYLHDRRHSAVPQRFYTHAPGSAPATAPQRTTRPRLAHNPKEETSKQEDAEGCQRRVRTARARIEREARGGDTGADRRRRGHTRRS